MAKAGRPRQPKAEPPAGYTKPAARPTHPLIVQRDEYITSLGLTIAGMRDTLDALQEVINNFPYKKKGGTCEDTYTQLTNLLNAKLSTQFGEAISHLDNSLRTHVHIEDFLKGAYSGTLKMEQPNNRVD